jgi:putative transcriptional regulator
MIFFKFRFKFQPFTSTFVDELFDKFIYPRRTHPCMPINLPARMASEITLSENPGLTIKKWREIFQITQHELAARLKVSSSVISDYEHGRRQSPGINIVRRIIEGMINIDESRGAPVIKRYSAPDIEAILDIREFFEGRQISDFSKKISAEYVIPNDQLDKHIYGYTVIDSLKAILTFSAEDYLRIFGLNSDRALIFTGVKFGRSPMIAIRTHTLKPAVIVFHKPERIDPLAIKLAKLENIVFLKTDLNLKDLLKELRKF